MTKIFVSAGLAAAMAVSFVSAAKADIEHRMMRHEMHRHMEHRMMRHEMHRRMEHRMMRRHMMHDHM